MESVTEILEYLYLVSSFFLALANEVTSDHKSSEDGQYREYPSLKPFACLFHKLITSKFKITTCLNPSIKGHIGNTNLLCNIYIIRFSPHLLLLFPCAVAPLFTLLRNCLYTDNLTYASNNEHYILSFACNWDCSYIKNKNLLLHRYRRYVERKHLMFLEFICHAQAPHRHPLVKPLMNKE